MKIQTALMTATAIAVTLAGVNAGAAAGKYDTGASDTEIVLGNVVPYSGPVSSAGAIGACSKGYFEMVNKRGGINGRQVRVESLDDGYNPSRTLEQTRRLVEREQVLLMYNTFGTAANSAIHQYLHQRAVPQMMIISGASKWNNPEEFPYAISFFPSYRLEGESYAKYVLENVADPKIAVLYQNDDYGREYIDGFRVALGDKADQLIITAQSYEVTDATVEPQVAQLRASGANVLLNITAAKFASQAVKLVNESGWKPLHLLVSPASNLDTVVRPAGIEASQGIISAQFMKDPTNPAFEDDADVKEWLEWKSAFHADAAPGDWWNWACYANSFVLEHVLREAGDDLTRENIMRITVNLQDLEVPMLMDGVIVNTTPEDYSPIKQMYMMRLEGDRWVPIEAN